MANEQSTYTGHLTTLQKEILEVLRAFESIQEEIRPGITAECQARMVSVVRDTFRRGLYQLYELRDRLPLIAPHFLLDSAKAPVPAAADSTARGFIQRERDK